MSPTAPVRWGRSRRGVPSLIVLLGAAIVAGCGSGGAAPATPPGGSPATSTPAGSPAMPSASPTPASTPVPATVAPSVSPVESPLAEPPAATLAWAGGAPVAGALGGYTWGDAGSDAPWIVVRARDAAAGTGPWTIAFGAGPAVTRWTAAWAPIRDGRPGTVAGYDQGSAGPVTFAGPDGGGPWTLKVEAWFGDAGHAAYFWRLAGAP